MKQKKQLIAISGPTGAGKTALAVQVAKHTGGVLISADSRQVYSGLDIGTNKEGIPGTWEEMPARIIDGIPQLLIDIVQPGERFTLHDWLHAAQTVIEKIWNQGRIPIVVGGTGLYVTALIEGYQPGSGRYSQKRHTVDFESLLIIPSVNREVLYQKSDERFLRVFDLVVEETKKIINRGVSSDWLESLGLDYRFASYFLRQRMNREIAIAQFQQASRHYIRRQITWWRHHGQPTYLQQEEVMRNIDAFLNHR